MKILQVNTVYKKGSTGKIVYDLHTELLKNGYESIVCYGRGERIKEENVYKVCSELYSKFNNLLSRVSGMMYGGCYFSTRKLISIIKKEKPNVVHLHCLNGYFVNIYGLITWLKKNHIKTILTLHAEFMYTANCGHAYECEKWKNGCGKCLKLKENTKSILLDNTHKSWVKMYNAFKDFKNIRIVSVSPWLMNRAKQSPILKEKNHCVVFNGINTEVFKKYETLTLRKKMNLKDEKVVLHVTANFDNDKNEPKGGYYILKLAEMLKNENIKIIVIGKYNKKIINNDKVILLGEIKNQELLAQYYSLADVTVITSKKETFSMPVAESLCCGTPVIGFEAGAPEQIAIPNYSDFVKYGDIDGLCRLVVEYVNNKSDNDMINVAVNKYSKEKMFKEYINLYNMSFVI